MRERPSRTEAVGPQLQADLQRGLQRVRYLTQLALHSSLPPCLSLSHPLIYPFSSLAFFHEGHSLLPPPLSLPLYFLSALFPLTFAPKACLAVPIPEFSKVIKIKVEPVGGAAKEDIREELTQTSGEGRREVEG